MKQKVSVGVRVVQYVILILATIFAIYPIWFVVLASLRSGSLYAVDLPGMFVPTKVTFDNFAEMLFNRPFGTWLLNSIKVAGLTTVFSLFITTTAAFTLSRFRFPGRESILVFLLALSTFPALLALVAIAQLLTAIGLYNNHLGLILAYSAGTIVFCTWNMKGYFDSIPIELEEAARIDGCGPVEAFVLVALPLVRPALAVTALLAFLGGWGDFVFASVLVTSANLQLAVPSLYGLANELAVPWGYFAAGAVIVIIPTMIVFLLVQRNFESGLMAGGVKG